MGPVLCRRRDSKDRLFYCSASATSAPKMDENRTDSEAKTTSERLEEEKSDSTFRDLESKVMSLLETDGKISAIKSLRDECPYLSLADAKVQVERLEAGQSFLIKGGKLDGLPTASSSGSGCLIVALTVPVGLLTFKALEHLLF